MEVFHWLRSNQEYASKVLFGMHWRICFCCIRGELFGVLQCQVLNCIGYWDPPKVYIDSLVIMFWDVILFTTFCMFYAYVFVFLFSKILLFFLPFGYGVLGYCEDAPKDWGCEECDKARG